MPRKDHSPEQVLNKLRQVEVAVAGGRSVSDISKNGTHIGLEIRERSADLSSLG